MRTGTIVVTITAGELSQMFQMIIGHAVSLASVDLLIKQRLLLAGIPIDVNIFDRVAVTTGILELRFDPMVNGHTYYWKPE